MLSVWFNLDFFFYFINDKLGSATTSSSATTLAILKFFIAWLLPSWLYVEIRLSDCDPRAMTHVSTRWPLHPAVTLPLDARVSLTHTELIAVA